MADQPSAPESTVLCPHCGEPFAVGLGVLAPGAESRMVFRITPGPGEYLTADHAGQAIAQFGKLLKAIGRDQGVPVEAVIEKMESRDGEISVHVLIARWDDHQHSAVNRKRRSPETR
jgi:hypothetical protein